MPVWFCCIHYDPSSLCKLQTPPYPHRTYLLPLPTPPHLPTTAYCKFLLWRYPFGTGIIGKFKALGLYLLVLAVMLIRYLQRFKIISHRHGRKSIVQKIKIFAKFSQLCIIFLCKSWESKAKMPSQ